MKRLLDPFFMVYLVTWSLVRLSRHLDVSIGYLNDHLTDFIAVPAMAHVSIYITKKWIIKDPLYRYPLLYLLFIAAYTSIVMEWWMPVLSSKYTADFLDVIAYFSGALFYYYVHVPLVTRYAKLNRS